MAETKTFLTWTEVPVTEVLVGDIMISDKTVFIVSQETLDNLEIGTNASILVGINRPLPLRSVASDVAIASWSAGEWDDDKMLAWMQARSPGTNNDDARAVITYMKAGRAAKAAEPIGPATP